MPSLSAVFAHYAPGLSGDGTPTWFIYSTGLAALTLAALAMRARGSKTIAQTTVQVFSGDRLEDPWPAPSPFTQAFGLAGLVAVLAIGWFGSDLTGLNPLPVLLSVLWWSVPLTSFLFGDLWCRLDPFDAVATVFDQLRPDRKVSQPEDSAHDWWIPVLGLASFGFMSACWIDGLRPRPLAAWLSLLSVTMTVGAWRGGHRWVQRNSPFSLLAMTFASLGPFARRRLIAPLQSVGSVAGGPRTLGIICFYLGATLWDAVAGTPFWADLIGQSGTGGTVVATAISVLGLTACVAVCALVWFAFGRVVEHSARQDDGSGLNEAAWSDLAPMLAWLAGAAMTAHQLTRMIGGFHELALQTLPDPFGLGWNLFGTRSKLLSESTFAGLGWAWGSALIVIAGTTAMLITSWDRLCARLSKPPRLSAMAVLGWCAIADLSAFVLIIRP